jgi:hypothetical protein
MQSNKAVGINQYFYHEKYLTQKLLTFIDKHHNYENYMFWPDLVSSHYAKQVVLMVAKTF